MSTALTRSLPDLAARINAQHELCEGSYRTALKHALRVGELLGEAKAQLSHGDWLPWLAAHTRVSERNAQRYMQLSENPTLVSGLGIKDALQTIAQPVAKASPDLRSALRGVEKADAEAALAELGEMPEASVFPSSAMERTTWRQIRESLSRVTRAMDEGAAEGISKWSRREALHEASRHARGVASQLSELADTLAS